MTRRSAVLIASVLILAAGPVRVAAEPPLAAYFPMAPGTVWTFRTNTSGEIVMRVGAAIRVGAFDCRLIETVVESTTTQQECYRVERDGIYALQRSYSSGTVLLTPPQRMLASPVVVGERWQWNGRIGEQTVVFDYTWARAEKVVTPAGTFPAMQLYFRADLGPEVQVQSWRWFAPGIGMVKEDTTLRQGPTPLRIYAELIKATMGK